jgi:hypothetical protein
VASGACSVCARIGDADTNAATKAVKAMRANRSNRRGGNGRNFGQGKGFISGWDNSFIAHGPAAFGMDTQFLKSAAVKYTALQWFDGLPPIHPAMAHAFRTCSGASMTAGDYSGKQFQIKKTF